MQMRRVIRVRAQAGRRDENERMTDRRVTVGATGRREAQQQQMQMRKVTRVRARAVRRDEDELMTD